MVVLWPTATSLAFVSWDELHFRAAAARHAKAQTMAGSISFRVFMPLVAKCSDGGDHPGVAVKSDWRHSLVFVRSDVDWACLCSRSRECDPLGDSRRSLGSGGEGVLHSLG